MCLAVRGHVSVGLLACPRRVGVFAVYDRRRLRPATGFPECHGLNGPPVPAARSSRGWTGGSSWRGVRLAARARSVSLEAALLGTPRNANPPGCRGALLLRRSAELASDLPLRCAVEMDVLAAVPGGGTLGALAACPRVLALRPALW